VPALPGESARYERATARWIARLIAERPAVPLSELELAAAAFREAPHDPRGEAMLRALLEGGAGTRPSRSSPSSRQMRSRAPPRLRVRDEGAHHRMPLRQPMTPSAHAWWEPAGDAFPPYE
jgi:hypothetical protein